MQDQAAGKTPGTKIFLCWSGERSRKLAHDLRCFLWKVFDFKEDDIFLSTRLEKGVRWFEEILRHLEGARAGIVCLTAENLASPWLHFEAGALAKGLRPSGTGNDSVEPLRNRMFTYLHGVPGASLSGPFAEYQTTATTREETEALVQALIRILCKSKEGGEEVMARFPVAWQTFQNQIRDLNVTVPELLPRFEDWFRRKTFDEPVQQCTDQNWAGRFEGASVTHTRLAENLEAVRKACPRYQFHMYDRLRALVESYRMDISGLLLTAPKFKVLNSGELDIQPPGIREACESRRRRIKTIVSRLLDPKAIAFTEEAAAFWLSDSFEQRKMFVHRQVVSARNEEQIEALLASVWDLDRILAYLHIESDYAANPKSLLWAQDACWRELERRRASETETTLMPLHYGLGALHAAVAKTPNGIGPDARTRVQLLLTEIRTWIDASAKPDPSKRLDKGGQVQRTLDLIEQALPSNGHSAG